ncbi:MAG: AAA family ATPase [Candidatus Omnitrophota bacterium]|nr:AAA family ATPase [Candidatus Omnitrophota bacterium]
MRIISIASQKGGCGKTTTAINLAAALALNGCKTLLVDLDPQSHASLGLNINSQDSIYNVLSNITPRKLKFKDIIVKIENNFDLAPSNILLGTVEQELAEEIGRESKLKQELDSLNNSYDYILIDCPPNLGLLTINSIRASKEVIMPVETSRFSLVGVERLIEITDLIKERLNHTVTYNILVTIFDSRLRHSFSMLDKIRKEFGQKMFNTIIHINVKLKEANVMGSSVINFDKYSRGAKDYCSLARELMLSDRKAAISNLKDIKEKMQELVKQKSKEFIEATFRIAAPSAHNVYVAGDFNNWTLDEAYKLKTHNGVWFAKLPLKQGHYRYRFVVDGKWQEDPQNNNTEKNPFGELDSLLDIK